MSYDTRKVEKKWKDKWFSTDIYKTEDISEKPKKYVLVEFPYPSGSGLHIGHAFSFTGGDVYARYQRMRGFNVLFPMGWDAFGLPTENYAIKMKRKPQDVTKENTEMFKKQMKELGFSFDWDREINTTDPEYYKWTQWIFIKLFEKGLAYKEEMPINWCPSCKIGLANEEVVDNCCERCGTTVGKKTLSQWMLAITKYGDRLSYELEETDFPNHVKDRQINWIDRKEWIDITYPIEGFDETVTVATTRPDTNFGATFIVLAPEHKLVDQIIGGDVKVGEDVAKIKEYVMKARNKSELDRQKEVLGRDKSGVFTGLYAINHLTGTKMPVWITDFVLSTVGTGAVVGVPGHDVRDFEFAQQFGLPIIRVVVGRDGDTSEITRKEQVQEEEGTMINSGFLDGMDIKDATSKIMDYIEEQGWGKRSIRYHLRDWIFSRQHYWGEPIPMVECEKCGWVPVDEKDLPIKLPELDHYEPTDDGKSPLSKVEEWVNTNCPKCGGDAKRETDTMPNWAGSSWYYLRFIDSNNANGLGDFDKLKYWLPVDIYVGGSEHTTLHLLYSRFWHKVLNDISIVPSKEPYLKRVEHGVILGPDGKRMSKSKGNVIVPEDVSDKVGVDATRAYLMFMGPFDGTMAWNDSALMGVKRFTERLYKLYEAGLSGLQNGSETSSESVLSEYHKTVKAVTDMYGKFQFNTVVAKYMELLNYLEKVDQSEISKDVFEGFAKMIAPIMPFLAEELWSMIGNEYSIHSTDWPMNDEKYLLSDTVEIPVQINGKVRGRVVVKKDTTQEDILEIIRNDKTLGRYLGDAEVKKVVYVLGKIINLIV